MIHEFEAISCMTFRYLGHEEYNLTRVIVPKTHRAVNLVRLKKLAVGHQICPDSSMVWQDDMSQFHSIHLCLRSTLTMTDKPYNQATRAIYIPLRRHPLYIATQGPLVCPHLPKSSPCHCQTKTI